MKTRSTLRPREKEISVFLIDKDDAKKIGEVDRVSVFDHAGNKLIDNLYDDFPEASFYEKLLETESIPPESELRLGMFFEVTSYAQKAAAINYFWYLKSKKNRIFLLISHERVKAIQEAEKERRLFFSGVDILRMQILKGKGVVEKNVAFTFGEERECEECGKIFTVSPRHRERQRFCSPKCRRKNFYRTHKQ